MAKQSKDPAHVAVVGIVSLVAVVGLVLLFVSVAPFTNVGKGTEALRTKTSTYEDTTLVKSGGEVVKGGEAVAKGLAEATAYKQAVVRAFTAVSSKSPAGLVELHGTLYPQDSTGDGVVGSESAIAFPHLSTLLEQNAIGLQYAKALRLQFFPLLRSGCESGFTRYNGEMRYGVDKNGNGQDECRDVAGTLAEPGAAGRELMTLACRSFCGEQDECQYVGPDVKKDADAVPLFVPGTITNECTQTLLSGELPPTVKSDLVGYGTAICKQEEENAADEGTDVSDGCEACLAGNADACVERAKKHFTSDASERGEDPILVKKHEEGRVWCECAPKTA